MLEKLSSHYLHQMITVTLPYDQGDFTINQSKTNIMYHLTCFTKRDTTSFLGCSGQKSDLT